MRFLEKEKIMIILLYHLEINFFLIAKIISGLRNNITKGDLIVNLKIKDPKVFKVIHEYEYVYDVSRDKKCNRTAILNVVEKWKKESSTKNGHRSNYTTKISQERIDYLCNFVKESKKKSPFIIK